MRTFYLQFLLSTMYILCFGQENRYEGVINDPEVNQDFAKGTALIKASISSNLNNLNLFEYSHALPELYSLLEANKIKDVQWKRFVDSLENRVKIHKNDTLLPYWAVDYTGIIPLQAQFFIASINKNEKLNKQYPRAFLILKENTSSMLGLGYKPEEFDSLLKISEVVGETNFWYFFQLEGCRYVKDVIKKKPKLIEQYRAITQSMDMTSTYKIPLYLQKRKWYTLQKRLYESNDPLCLEGANNMKNVSIRIEDKNQHYFKEALLDGIDRNKTKTF